MKLKSILRARYSIRTKMIVSLVFLLVLSFSVTNYMNFRSSRISVRSNLINSVLPLTSDNIYSEIQKNMIRPVFISSLMSNDTFLKDWAISGEKNSGNIKKYLNAIKKKYGFFTTFFVSEKTGKYYYQEGVLKSISLKDSHDIWYYRFKNLNREYALDVDSNEAEKNMLTIFINHRVEDYKGSLLGVTGVGLKMDEITRLLHSYNDKYGGSIYLTDPDGLIQVHSDEKIIEKTNVKELLGSSEIARRSLVKEKDGKFFEFDRDNQHLLLSVRYISEFDWFLFVEINETDNMKVIRSNLYRNLAIGLLISVLIISVAIMTVNYFQKRLVQLAVIDELTGAYNRREFETQFKRAVYSLKRGGESFSLIIFDIDNFKSVNDNLGHLEGDRVLQGISKIAEGCIRLTDLLFRWGGDEFVIIAYGETDKALLVAERIRAAVEKKKFLLSNNEKKVHSLFVTLSCGIAFYQQEEAPDSILARADRALYRAKEKGRNRIEQA